jgi:hypothetical protein
MIDLFLLVCSLVGSAYLHYVFSRADLEHLAVALFPFWLGIFVQLSHSRIKLRIFLGAALAVSAFSITAPYHLVKLTATYQSGTVAYEIGKDRIFLGRDTAAFLDMVAEILKNEKPGDGFMAYPHLTTIYPVFGLKSPTWKIYSLFPCSEVEQERIIREIRENNVRWALIKNTALDGNDALRFQKTSPLVWQYLVRNYRVIPSPNGYQDCFLFFQSDRTPKF